RSIVDAHRSGRPRRTEEEEEDRLIVAAAVADLFMSAREIWDKLDLSLSCYTIRPGLKQADLGTRSAD
ncbi:hypothetical protein HPB47_010472, partial [Ixodes persulcatus]